LEQSYSPMTVRFFILQAHYRSTLDFSNEALKASEKGLKRMLQAYRDLKVLAVSQNVSEETGKEILRIKENIFLALCDDLNTPIALSHLFEAVKMINLVKEGKLEVSKEDKEALIALFDEVFIGILGIEDEHSVESSAASVTSTVIDGLMEMVISERIAARANKDWEKSDKIRDDLKGIGVNLKDTKNGMEWNIDTNE
jgi:cysteinyl-tRNA synthetase